MNIHYGLVTTIFSLFLMVPAYAAWDIQALSSLMEKQERVEVLYKEEKYISLLDNVVYSSGRLLYIAPNLLEKQVEHPIAQVMHFDRKRLSMTEGGKVYIVDASTMPEVSSYLVSILNLLSGRKDALLADFSVELTGSEKSWQLVLLPKHHKLKTVLRRAEIQGTTQHIQKIRLDQADGDSSEMQLSPIR
ncbi:MAG: outer membrane lipoprotein carrier protein LolA [Gammaproteobacteria bacterium]|nr:outer membrane lipoprotein carrier protein LolA [Gammaproteobacteria bacterium]